MCSLFLVLAFTTDRKNDNSVNAKAEAAYNQTTTAFIDNIGETARQIGQDYNIYASVLIAQAILESNSGQSGLSQAPYYNFFGIKGTYNGNSVTMRTWEDDGTGKTYEIDEPFPFLWKSKRFFSRLCCFDDVINLCWHMEIKYK